MQIGLVTSHYATRLHADESLRLSLQRFGVPTEIHHFRSGTALMARFEPDRFSVIFLDVDDDANIEIAHTIRASDVRCLIVFLSQNSEHMSEAFSCHAFDYIMKPQFQDHLPRLVRDMLRMLPMPEKSLCFRWRRQDISIPCRQIVCLTARRNNTEIHDARGDTWISRTKFSSMAAALADDVRFLDVNRGILVNMEHLVTIEGDVCYLDNGMIFPLRVRGQSAIRTKWLQYKSMHA